MGLRKFDKKHVFLTLAKKWWFFSIILIWWKKMYIWWFWREKSCVFNIYTICDFPFFSEKREINLKQGEKISFEINVKYGEIDENIDTYGDFELKKTLFFREISIFFKVSSINGNYKKYVKFCVCSKWHYQWGIWYVFCFVECAFISL